MPILAYTSAHPVWWIPCNRCTSFGPPESFVYRRVFYHAAIRRKPYPKADRLATYIARVPFWCAPQERLCVQCATDERAKDEAIEREHKIDRTRAQMWLPLPKLKGTFVKCGCGLEVIKTNWTIHARTCPDAQIGRDYEDWKHEDRHERFKRVRASLRGEWKRRWHKTGRAVKQKIRREKRKWMKEKV